MSSSSYEEVDDAAEAAAAKDAYALAVMEQANVLGIDPYVDGDLLFLAEESLRAPLPDGWV